MRTAYIYDGSWEGMLTVFYCAFQEKQVPVQIVRDARVQLAFDLYWVEQQTDAQKAAKMAQAIQEKLGETVFDNIYTASLSELPGSEIDILQYLRLGFRIGNKMLLMLADDRVRRLNELCHKVGGEAHRIKGLLRFREIQGGAFYAAYEPDHNITAYFAQHFIDRFGSEAFIIHDVRRGIALLYDRNEAEIVQVPDTFVGPAYTEAEYGFSAAWKEYFVRQTIESRINPKLQRSCMPRRYWKYMPELHEDVKTKAVGPKKMR